jgi:hypothetical protein
MTSLPEETLRGHEVHVSVLFVLRFEFNNTLNCSDLASNDRMIMNWKKNVERNGNGQF